MSLKVDSSDSFFSKILLIINLSLSNTKVKFNKEKAVVTFTQNYKSGALNQTSIKTLVFIEEGNDWLILEETSK